MRKKCGIFPILDFIGQFSVFSCFSSSPFWLTNSRKFLHLRFAHVFSVINNNFSLNHTTKNTRKSKKKFDNELLSTRPTGSG